MITIGDPQPRDEGSAAAGIGIVFTVDILLSIVVLFVAPGIGDTVPWLSGTLFIAVMGIGLTQLLYVVPLYLSFKKSGKNNTAKGLVIGASIVALLNAACWGLVANLKF